MRFNEDFTLMKKSALIILSVFGLLAAGFYLSCSCWAAGNCIKTMQAQHDTCCKSTHKTEAPAQHGKDCEKSCLESKIVAAINPYNKEAEIRIESTAITSSVEDFAGNVFVVKPSSSLTTELFQNEFLATAFKTVYSPLAPPVS